MKIKVQSLNTAGIEIFRSWLVSPIGNPPSHILDDSHYVDEIQQEYMIDTDLKFETAFELGKYLHEIVFPDVSDVASHSAANGMWTWVSLALIKSLLRRSGKLKDKPLDVPHYIQISQFLAYRLITRTSWKLVRLHGKLAEVAIGSKRSPWGEMAEQMTSRQEVFAHPSFWEVAMRLYRTSSGELRRGATSQRPKKAKKDPKIKLGLGSVRRLPMTFRQFDRTYNTRDMSINQMLQVLPREYAKWVIQD